jgi:hypothetical protein
VITRSGTGSASVYRWQAKMYGIWAYFCTFSRVWAFIWKLGSESGTASNKNQNPDPHPDPNPHQRDKSNPDTHQTDANPQHSLNVLVLFSDTDLAKAVLWIRSDRHHFAASGSILAKCKT